jgi:hypothetical protein
MRARQVSDFLNSDLQLAAVKSQTTRGVQNEGEVATETQRGSLDSDRAF